jgi:hypothetical protein
VRAHGFSVSARQKIEAAGGTATVIVELEDVPTPAAPAKKAAAKAAPATADAAPEAAPVEPEAVVDDAAEAAEDEAEA